MRKSVGIVTLWYKDCNFGSTIQNWALHQYLQKKFNFDTFTIVNKKYEELDLKWKEFYAFSDKTWNTFEEFKKKIKQKICFSEEIKESDATLFIIGGDQVINSYSIPTFDLKYNLLSNISKDKKILYSAGCSCQQFSYPHNEVTDLCLHELTTNIHSLSFREKLDQFSHETQYIDPALLLDKCDYAKIEEKPKGDIPEKFDFLYCVKHSDSEFIKILNFFLKNRKSKYSLITNRDDLNLGPKQILWCIHHCQTFYTNSLHGFIFTIIFNKKILLYNPTNFRMKNIFTFLNIKLENNKITNYREVQKNIKIQKQRSFEYLNKNFKECLELQKQEKYPKVYAAFRKDKTLRDLSASGGISALLAETIFEKKGVVWGAAYGQNFCSVYHVCVSNIHDYYHLIATSKYNISSLKNVFPKVESQLKKGILVSFTGTPCQIFALKKYLKTDYDNLLTVDLLCHGVSKQDVLKQYINKIENDCKSKVINLNMRDHHHHTTTTVMENGQVFTDNEAVHKIFINEKYLHNMCRKCDRHYSNNVSDITLGDFWDIEKYIINDSIFTRSNLIQIGINKVKIHSAKAEKFWNLISDKIEFRKV